MPAAPRRRHHRGALTAAALTLGLLAPFAVTAPAAADNSAIGYPVYSGADHPVPALPAGFTVHRTLRAQYEADRKAGDGTDFWMDRMLGRKGEDPAGDWLFTRGHAVFMKEHDPARLGFAGKAAYWESIDNRSAYTLTLNADGENLTFREDTGARTQTPSYWRSEFTHEATGLKVTQTKFTLPATVVATYNDGSKDSRTKVTWDPVDPDQYAGPGTFEVKGTVPDTSHRATATVTVTPPG